MTEIVSPPLIDGVIAAMLEAQTGVLAATKVPDVRPDTFIRVLVTGGSGRSSVAVYRATVVVESWAPTAPEAQELAVFVDGAMYASPYLAPEIRAVTSASAVTYFPDPDSRQERYSATYNVTARSLARP